MSSQKTKKKQEIKNSIENAISAPGLSHNSLKVLYVDKKIME